ncbi:MAG: hypothetical protein HDR19_03690 [Lachnospiraceae bacterium]|nr:hypothetical protein [Lachnospiraceae bacterium]
MIKNALWNAINDIEHIKRNAVVQIIIATIAFILLMRVFPQGAVQNHTYARQKAYQASELKEISADAFTENDKKLQTVYFSQEHLYAIKLYVVCNLPDKSNGSDYVLFRLYDENFSCIYEEKRCCADMAKDGFLLATPDMDVDPEKAYYYEMLVPYDKDLGEYCRAELALPVADRGQLGQTENGILYIDGIINEDVSLVADFDYSTKLTAMGILLYYVMIIAAAVVLYIVAAVALYLYDSRLSQNSAGYMRYARIGASALVLAFAVFLFIFSVILNRFGVGAVDRSFFTVATLVGTAWLMLAIWLRDRYPAASSKTKLTPARKLSLIWRNYIQTVSFGLLFYALCQYVNADREYYHYTNTRWMLIFLAIALLMMYREVQFFNILSILWLVGSVIGSAVYCRDFETGTNEHHLAALTCGVVVSWGFLILNILIQLIKALMERKIHPKKPTALQMVYGLLWVVFSVLLYVYRFEKTWVFTAVLPFLTLFFLCTSPALKSRLLKNFTNGILLGFGFVTLFCFIHRPHHYWMLYRYGGIFHTVACTGMYLAVVFGAAVGKLFGKLKNRENILISCPFECFITSVTAGYIFLTMSRTAYLSTFVTAALVVLLAAFAFRKRLSDVIKEIGILTLLVLLCFPLVFSAVRMIPAVINEPIRYDLEHQDRGFMIYRGDPIDSDKYMTVPRFFATLFGRFQREETVTDEENEEEARGGSLYLAYTGADFAGADLRMAKDDHEEADGDEEEDDISNGRFGIFKDYVRALSLEGHEKMALVNEKGKERVHAHNSYLQVAYNFGMIAGVVFLAICVLSLYSSIRLVMVQGEKFGIYLVPFTLVIVFGIVSLTEWAFHPCIPAGFSFLFLQPLFIGGPGGENQRGEV